jgi:hypothetical protein
MRWYAQRGQPKAQQVTVQHSRTAGCVLAVAAGNNLGNANQVFIGFAEYQQ